MRRPYLTPLLLLILAFTASAEVTIEQTTYHAWPNAWRISNDSCELVIVPQITRVMRFALKDGKNILWEDPKLAGKTFPTDDGTWHNIGGEKLWPTQQKDLFKKYTGKDGWPPPYPWDAGASQAERIDNGVRLTIPHDPRFGAHAVREFTLDPREPRVHVRQWIEKTQGDPAEMTVWTVCQADDPVLAILPRDSTQAGYQRMGEIHEKARDAGNVVALDRDARDGVKIGVIADNTPGNGWVATTFTRKAARDGGGILFVQSHRALRDATYPDDGCQAELYQAPVGFAKYTEMELLSPLVALKSGEQLRDDAVWQLLRVDDDVAKDANRAGAAAAKAHEAALRELPEPRTSATETKRDRAWQTLKPCFSPPPDLAAEFGSFRSPLLFDDGTRVKDARDWPRRREEILRKWHGLMGPWPPLIEKPGLEVLEHTARPDHARLRVRVQVAADQWLDGYLLIPSGAGPFPAVLVPYYEPQTAIGENPKQPLRDFAIQLTRRGFVTLSIGSPGGDARKPDRAGNVCQPLSYLAYVAANCATALAQRPEVDARRIGVVGHSYGGKWAMFASCLCDRFAAAVWSDPGIVFDDTRPNINYWEPWYLGFDPSLSAQRKPGLPTADDPLTGAYKLMRERGVDLVELHALMAPRPVLVSGGSEDTASRWNALNHLVAVNRLLGWESRVAMHNRRDHPPTEESNAVIYAFFEHFLGPR